MCITIICILMDISDVPQSLSHHAGKIVIFKRRHAGQHKKLTAICINDNTNNTCMAKQNISARLEKEVIEQLDEIAKKRYENNRNAAIEDAIDQFVGKVPRCPICGEVAREDELLCPQCAVPLTAEVRADIQRMRELLADYPEVIMAAIQDYVQEKERMRREAEEEQ